MGQSPGLAPASYHLCPEKAMLHKSITLHHTSQHKSQTISLLWLNYNPCRPTFFFILFLLPVVPPAAAAGFAAATADFCSVHKNFMLADYASSYCMMLTRHQSPQKLLLLVHLPLALPLPQSPLEELQVQLIPVSKQSNTLKHCVS